MTRWSTAIGGSILGAGLMFLMDPAGGIRRRKLFRDRLASWAKRSSASAGEAARDLANRTRGTVHELKREGQELESANGNGGVPVANFEARIADHTIEERVRSRMGHVIARPCEVHTAVVDGCVSLSGFVPPEELTELLAELERVPGVQSVENRLETERPARSPEPARKRGAARRLAIARTPAARLVAGSVGVLALASVGMAMARSGRRMVGFTS